MNTTAFAEPALTGRLAGKVVVVTGAARGIGLAVAQAAHDAGARVALLDRDFEAVSIAAKTLGPDSALAIQIDLAELHQIDSAVQQVVHAFNRIDVLVNVAGIQDQMEPVEVISAEVWNRVFDINVRGTAFMIQRVLREMFDSGGGAIVNTASTAAFIAGGGGSAYVASKGAITSLTRQVAYEVADRHVRVNAVAPGATATEILDTSSRILGRTASPEAERALQKAINSSAGAIPMGRPAQSKEIADAVIFLASNEASYITGSTLVVDGGLTII